jgi:translation initiation factor 1 (eIF-1/SUI1)
MLLAILACIPPHRSVGLLRLAGSPPLGAVRTDHSAIACKASAADDDAKQLLASLNAGLNSWSDFDAGAPALKPKASTKNAAKQKTKRKGRDGKVYLRDGPKRPAAPSRPAATRKASGVSSASIEAAIHSAESNLRANARVRNEESQAGGKKLTIIRGLERLPSDRARQILKGIKQALAVGGRLDSQGHLVVQGAHAEACLLRLQKAGFCDVQLAGGAGAAQTGKPAWNAPKELRQLSNAREQDAKRAAAVARGAKRNARRSMK